MKEALSVEDTLKLALEALERLLLLAEHEGWKGFDKQYAAITAIKEALMSLQDGAQPAVTESHKQSTTCGEPVAWIVHDRVDSDRLTFVEVKESLQTEVTPLYKAPPQRTWVGLTDEEIAEMWFEILGSTPPSGIHEDGLQPWRFSQAIEAKLKEKNNDTW